MKKDTINCVKKTLRTKIFNDDETYYKEDDHNGDIGWTTGELYRRYSTKIGQVNFEKLVFIFLIKIV